jgi:hypothetical protein
MKTLIITRRRDATAERGACFHLTIGSVNPIDLPLATPKLDHDALKGNSFFWLNESQGRRLLSSSRRILAMVFTIPSKEVYLSASLATLQPCLSACVITLLAISCDQNTLIS